MVRKWKNPKNVLNGGRYADIVKKGGLKDLETWKQVKAEDRLQVYNATLIIFALILSLNGFDSFCKTYNPQRWNKKTETLDSVLVAKNFYRLKGCLCHQALRTG